MKKKSGHRRRTKVVRRSRKNFRRTIKRKRLGKSRRRPTRRYSRVQRGGNSWSDKLNCFVTVGDIYYDGDNKLVRDHVMAFKLYSYAAKNKNAEAQFKLGGMYERGQGVGRDYVEAARLLRLAAEGGHAVAQYNLGGMFEYGDGVEMNKKEAARWYQLAAKQGHADAQVDLGNMFEKGQGVAQDEDQAMRWWQLAAAEGNKSDDALGKLTRLTDNLNCFVTVGDIYYYGNDDLERDYVMAFKLYSVAAENNNTEAQFKLGEMYRRGLGVEKNIEEARRLYQLAAAKGHEEAKKYVEYLRLTKF